MKNKHLIDKFKKLHNELIILVDTFPENERGEILFDKWSIKDVLIHIAAWNKNDISRFRLAMLDGDPSLTWIDDLDEFNVIAIKEAKDSSWENVYQDFVSSGNELTEIAEKLPDLKWEVTIDPEHKMTLLKDFLYTIEHYEDEHIPQLKAVKF